MEALDTNGDGELDANEIANASDSLLQLDIDGDGKLSRDELRPKGQGGTGNRPWRSGWSRRSGWFQQAARSVSRRNRGPSRYGGTAKPNRRKSNERQRGWVHSFPAHLRPSLPRWRLNRPTAHVL